MSAVKGVVCHMQRKGQRRVGKTLQLRHCIDSHCCLGTSLASTQVKNRIHHTMPMLHEACTRTWTNSLFLPHYVNQSAHCVTVNHDCEPMVVLPIVNRVVTDRYGEYQSDETTSSSTALPTEAPPLAYPKMTSRVLLATLWLCSNKRTIQIGKCYSTDKF